jgi:two-component system phosphate regulon response regulator PhoB
MSERILLAEPDDAARRTLEESLSAAGFAMSQARDGAATLDALRSAMPALVVLDLSLRAPSGLDVLRRIRREHEHARLPVIVTGAEATETDRVVVFELGADDFVPKPYSPREVVLRIQAVLRRVVQSLDAVPATLVLGPITLDGPRHRATVHGREIPLTTLELRLLQYLMVQRDHAITRATLLERVWGVDPDAETRTVDTHVKRLRAKLGDAGHLLETLRGVGYRLRDPGR